MTDDDYDFLVSRFQPIDAAVDLAKTGHITLCVRKVYVEEINRQCQAANSRGDDQAKTDHVMWR